LFNDGAAYVYHTLLAKLATTATGIDVTGSIVADGLSIGTTADAYSAIFITSSVTGESELRMGDTDTDAGSISYTNVNDTMTFRAAAASRLTINSTGIDVTGTATMDGLTVVASNALGTIQASSATDATLNITSAGITAYSLVTSGTDSSFAIKKDGAERMRLDASGNVLVGTASPYGTNVLSVNGGIAIDGRNASTPGLSEKSDPNTGIFWPATDTLAVTTAGTERMRIDSSGLVAIGTSSPVSTAQLTIGGTSRIAPVSGNGLLLASGGSDRMFISTAGNVGIGTSTMGAKLNVETAASAGISYPLDIRNPQNAAGTGAGAMLRIHSTSDANRGVGIASLSTTNYATDNSMLFYTSTGSTLSERMRITSGGALEIGPAANKVIIKSQGSFQNTTLESHIINADGTGAYGSGDVLIQPRCSSVSSNNIVFGTSGGTNTTTERMRIDASGNLLVGSTTASAKLFVEKAESGNSFGARNTSASNIGTVGFFGADRNTTNGTFHYIDCYNYGSSTYRFRVADSGNATNTNNSYGALSDVKLKENIIDSGSQWDDIKALRVRKYSLKSDSLDAPNQLGVIAQELESVGMAGLVSESEDRDEEGNNLGTVTKTVAYSVLYMKAVKALQEAMERIETLEAKVAALES
jgi:hypothetical protein